MSDRLALANAIEDAGIERAKAESIATAIARFVEGNAATRADVQASEAAIRGELSQLRAELKGEIVNVRSVLASETARLDTRIERLDGTVKAQPNAIMLRLGTPMVVLTGIILAALRYLPPHG